MNNSFIAPQQESVALKSWQVSIFRELDKLNLHGRGGERATSQPNIVPTFMIKEKDQNSSN